MKLLLISLFLGFLTACTGESGDIKNAAIADVQARYEAGVQEEALRVIPNSDWLQKEFSAFVKKHTEYQAKEVVKLGENQAKVTVVIVSLLPPHRQMLAEIASKVRPDIARNFNLTDALGMIAQKTKTPSKPTEISSNAVIVSRNGSNWVAVKP